MVIIGCDFHSGFQQLAIFDNQTGEISGEEAAASGAGDGVLPLAERSRCGWAWRRERRASGSGGC